MLTIVKRATRHLDSGSLHRQALGRGVQRAALHRQCRAIQRHLVGGRQHGIACHIQRSILQRHLAGSHLATAQLHACAGAQVQSLAADVQRAARNGNIISLLRSAFICQRHLRAALPHLQVTACGRQLAALHRQRSIRQRHLPGCHRSAAAQIHFCTSVKSQLLRTDRHRTTGHRNASGITRRKVAGRCFQISSVSHRQFTACQCHLTGSHLGSPRQGHSTVSVQIDIRATGRTRKGAYIQCAITYLHIGHVINATSHTQPTADIHVSTSVNLQCAAMNRYIATKRACIGITCKIVMFEYGVFFVFIHVCPGKEDHTTGGLGHTGLIQIVGVDSQVTHQVHGIVELNIAACLGRKYILRLCIRTINTAKRVICTGRTMRG